MILPARPEEGGVLKWKELGAFNLNLLQLPSGPGTVKLLLPEDLFFSLIEIQKGAKKIQVWEGILKNRRLVENFRATDTLKLFNEEKKKVKVTAITRCLIIKRCLDMAEEVPKLAENPCIKAVVKAGIGMSLRYTLKDPKNTFLREVWVFTHKTGGVCPPASCGNDGCTELGGTSVPVFITKKRVC